MVSATQKSHQAWIIASLILFSRGIWLLGSRTKGQPGRIVEGQIIPRLQPEVVPFLIPLIFFVTAAVMLGVYLYLTRQSAIKSASLAR